MTTPQPEVLFSAPVVHMARTIGKYFVHKHNGNIVEARKEIELIGFLAMEIKDDEIVLEVHRPGVLIGVKGQTYDGLVKYIGKKIHIIETKGILEDYIVPKSY